MLNARTRAKTASDGVLLIAWLKSGEMLVIDHAETMLGTACCLQAYSLNLHKHARASARSSLITTFIFNDAVVVALRRRGVHGKRLHQHYRSLLHPLVEATTHVARTLLDEQRHTTACSGS